MKKNISKEQLLQLVDYLIDLASEYDLEDEKVEAIEMVNESVEDNARL